MYKYLVSDEYGSHFFANRITFHMIESFTDGELNIVNINDKSYLSNAVWNESSKLLYDLTWSSIEFFQGYELS